LKYRIVKLLDRLHWLWLALAVPFLLFPTPKRSLAMLVIPGLWLLNWLEYRWSPNRALGSTQPGAPDRQPVLPYTPLNLVLLLLALMVLVSLWATYDIANSLPKISGMVLGFGVYFAIVREGDRPRGWWVCLLVFSGLALGMTILGLAGTDWLTYKITLLNPIIARLPLLIKGLPGAESGFSPNEIAGSLLWVLPLFLSLCMGCLWYFRTLFRSSGKVRTVLLLIVLLIASLFVSAVFVLTQSRAGYISLALTLMALILIALPARVRWPVLAALVVILLGSGFLVASHWEAAQAWITGSDLVSETGLSLSSLDLRLLIWPRAVSAIQDFPITGMGMNAFRKVVYTLYPIYTISSDRDFGHAHNEFLQAALDLGIPGLIAFIAIYIVAFKMLAELWKTTHSTSGGNLRSSLFPNPVLIRPLVLGLGGGLFAHLLYGLTDAVALGAKPGILFWMLLALISGLYKQLCIANYLDVPLKNIARHK